MKTPHFISNDTVSHPLERRSLPGAGRPLLLCGKGTAEPLRGSSPVCGDVAAEWPKLATENRRLAPEFSGVAAECEILAKEFQKRAAECGILAAENQKLAAEFGKLAAENRKLAAEFGKLAAKNQKLAAVLGVLAGDSRNLSRRKWLKGSCLGRKRPAALQSSTHHHENQSRPSHLEPPK